MHSTPASGASASRRSTRAHSLIRHLQRGWNFFRPERNESFDILPASQRVSETGWYAGTADAVFQNIDIIEGYAPRYIVLLAGDHVYKMDYELMLKQHVEQNADVTVGCIEVARLEASGFGVMAVDESDRITAFVEKPEDPPAIPGSPDTALASMGIYVFETRLLIDLLRRDAEDPGSTHDFGRDIIPYVVAHGTAIAHRFAKSCVRSSERDQIYWRDVGTGRCLLGGQYRPHGFHPWPRPLRIATGRSGPTGRSCRRRNSCMTSRDRRGCAISSLVSGGCIVSGSDVRRSLLFTGVHAHSYAHVESAVVLPYVEIGRRARLRDVVIDRGVIIPEGLVVGYDPALDAAALPPHGAGRPA